MNIRAPRFKSRALLAVSLTLLLASCAKDVTAPVVTPSGLDATGGSWKPIVLSSATQYTVEDPPIDLNSDAGKAELAQVKSSNTGLTASQISNIQYWDSNAVIRWNEVARNLVKANKTNPVVASRTYALLAIAQYDASVTTWAAKYKYNRQAPYKVDNTIATPTIAPNLPSYPSDHAAIAGASAEVLKRIYPQNAAYVDSLATAHGQSRIAGGYNFPSDVTTGETLGRGIADIVLQHASTDGSDKKWNDTIPVGAQYWYSAQKPAAPPLLPMWGDVGCWLITDMNSIEPPAPPAFGSAAYLADLHEVRQISDTRTAEQDAIAKKWSDDAGNTSTPPGHWNQIASDAIMSQNWSTIRTARAMALMNMAMLDAGVCCWKTKYVYWLIRPSEADTNITVAVPLPNFPSYCSGHSSFSGSASRVLGHLIPSLATEFDAMAQEASISRVYGGIHYRFDCTNALTMGQKVGDLAIARAKTDGAE